MRQYGHSGKIEPFATGLFNAWGVGNATTNTGVMMLVAQQDRQMRIELGASYPHSMDREMEQIIDSQMLPNFRSGQLDRGILLGVKALRATLTGMRNSPPSGFLDRVARNYQDQPPKFLLILAAIGSALSAAGLRLFQIWRRRRPRFCAADGTRMALMAEDIEDRKLQAGQTMEERLGSVDYDVWCCSKCDQVKIESYVRWFTRYGACPSCGFRTRKGKTTILRPATTSESGLKRIDYRCINCGVESSTTATIPREEDSGSDRSSFGGGSSSGGGASGRW